LSIQSADIAFENYMTYNEFYNIKFHNHMISLFNHIDLLKMLTFKFDYIHRVHELRMNHYLIPDVNIPSNDLFPDEMIINKCRPKFRDERIISVYFVIIAF